MTGETSPRLGGLRHDGGLANPKGDRVNRFGYNRSHSDQLIDAAIVVDILPTAEGEVRPITKLETQQQQEVWQQAVQVAFITIWTLQALESMF
ncbi:hypothetical protein LC593_31320 [Nostoc sp. CHAB 5844]|nr:hypothetical protein [Nostoc sp. CHAB 5844]